MTYDSHKTLFYGIIIQLDFYKTPQNYIGTLHNELALDLPDYHRTSKELKKHTKSAAKIPQD